VTPTPESPARATETISVIQQQTDETWAGWFRQHFSVFVLLFMCIFVFFYTLHIAHHTQDTGMLQWAQGHSQTFVGALVGALTSSGVQQLVNRPGPPK
jgi:succinate dehydrogenase hydrophobic anchor subunit